jgi:hypothetical protein
LKNGEFKNQSILTKRSANNQTAHQLITYRNSMSNSDIAKQIAMLEAAIQRKKQTFHPPARQAPTRPSKNMSLIVNNGTASTTGTSSYIVKGNSMVRTGLPKPTAAAPHYNKKQDTAVSVEINGQEYKKGGMSMKRKARRSLRRSLKKSATPR